MAKKPVFTMYLLPKDIRFIGRYAERLGLRRSTFLRSLVEGIVDGFRKETPTLPEDTRPKETWKRPSREICCIRLNVKDIAYIKEVAKKIGSSRARLLQYFLDKTIDDLRAKAPPLGDYERPLVSPVNTEFWRRYKEKVGNRRY